MAENRILNNNLQVKGVSQMWSGGGSHYYYFERNNELNVYTAAGDSSTMYLNFRGGDINFANTKAIIKSDTGNFGINVSAPSYKLDVGGDIRTSGNLYIGNTDDQNYITFNGTTGDVSNYSTTLIGERIYGGTEQSELILYKGNDGHSSTSGYDRIRLIGANLAFDVYGVAQSYPSDLNGVGALPTTRAMTIVGNGRVGIGVESPADLLHVDGTIRIGSTAYIAPVGQSMDLRKVNSISFAPNNGWNDPTYHGIMSTDSAGTASDSISINSYNDITLRLDANSNNDASYLRIMNNSAGNNTGSWFGYNGSTWQNRLWGNVGINAEPRTDSYKLNMGGRINMNNNDIHYANEVHFNSGTRFRNDASNYLKFRSDSTTSGGITLYDGGDNLKGYGMYWDASGNGVLNSNGSWGLRLSPGNGSASLYHAGSEKLGTVSYGARTYGDHRVDTNIYLDQNYGSSIVGAYSATRYQGVFAMGDAYKLSLDGTSPGTLYGIAWTHQNIGGESISGLGHQMLIMSNGDTRSAIGDGIWTKYDIRGARFVDQANTSYYVTPAATSNLLYIQMPHRGNGTENLLLNNGGSENWNVIDIAGGNNQNGIGTHAPGHSTMSRNGMSFHVNSSDSIRFHSSGWDTLLETAGGNGNTWIKGDLTVAGGQVYTNTESTRSKFFLWGGDNAYTIGMQNSYSYGHLDSYAMTFQMNPSANRGFWWGHSSMTNGQGAMSLTTEGRLTVATSISVGEGPNITSPGDVPLYAYSATDGSDVLAVDGVNGRLFTVTDSLDDSLFSVNTIAGLPVMEAFADQSIKLGPFTAPVEVTSTGELKVDGGTDLGTAVTGASVSNDTITFTRANGGTFSVTTSDADTNWYLDDITKSGNTLTYVMNGKTDVTYEFGSNAFNSTSFVPSAGGNIGGTLGIGRANRLALLHVQGTSGSLGRFTGDNAVINSLLIENTEGGDSIAIGSVGTDVDGTYLDGSRFISSSAGRFIIKSGDTVLPMEFHTGLGENIRFTIGGDGTISFPELTGGFLKTDSNGDVSVDTSTYLTSLPAHNHTSLTGVTSIGFAAQSSDSASISTTISGTSTFFDFNLTDDNNNDWWRWRFTPSGSTVYDAMVLIPTANGSASLSVTGNITANNIGTAAAAAVGDFAAASHSHGISGITDAYRWWNNNGTNHTTRQDFNTVDNFGWRFIQANTNGPSWNGSSQNYSVFVGLGNDYDYTKYGMQIAYPRNITQPYISIRYLENTTWGAWRKIAAGYADSAGNADTVDNLHASAFFRRDTSNDVDVRFAAGNGRGVNFWDSSDYKIWMSYAPDGTWGGRVPGETTSDYNMYFRMSGGTNRGFVFMNSVTPVAGIDAGGNARFTGDVVAYTSSDRRLKDNLTPIANACEKVQKLTGYEFDWNDNQDVYKGHDIGVVAQEVEEVLPEIVKTRDSGYKAVDYEKLVAVLIEANKELQNRVQTLEDRIDGLTK